MTKRRINVRGIVWRGDKLLAVKHKNSDGSELPYWAVPGGGLDPHEVLTDGVKREFLEETGVSVTVGKLLFIQQFPSTRGDYTEELEFFYEIQDSPEFDAVDLSKTTHGADEIARIAFVDPKSVEILPLFLSELDIDSYVSSDHPVYLNSKL